MTCNFALPTDAWWYPCQESYPRMHVSTSDRYLKVQQLHTVTIPLESCLKCFQDDITAVALASVCFSKYVIIVTDLDVLRATGGANRTLIRPLTHVFWFIHWLWSKMSEICFRTTLLLFQLQLGLISLAACVLFWPKATYSSWSMRWMYEELYIKKYVNLTVLLRSSDQYSSCCGNFILYARICTACSLFYACWLIIDPKHNTSLSPSFSP